MFNRMIQVQTTIDDRERAESIAGVLLQKRLAACVQIIGPVKSLYRWKGAVETSGEWALLIKTRASLYRKVERAIRENHPYEVPEIIALPIVRGGRDYLDWIAENTKKAGT